MIVLQIVTFVLVLLTLGLEIYIRILKRRKRSLENIQQIDVKTAHLVATLEIDIDENIDRPIYIERCLTENLLKQLAPYMKFSVKYSSAHSSRKVYTLDVIVLERKDI